MLITNVLGRTAGYTAFNWGVMQGQPADYSARGLFDRVQNKARSDTIYFTQQGGGMSAFGYGEDIRSAPRVEQTLTALVTPYGRLIQFYEFDHADQLYAGALDDVSEFGASIVTKDNELCTDAIEAGRPGGTLNSPDGVTLYNTAHPAQGDLSATQSNVVTVSANTVAGYTAALTACVSRFRGFKNYAGNRIFAGSMTLSVFYPTGIASTMLATKGSLPNSYSTSADELRAADGVRFIFTEDPNLDADANDFYVVAKQANRRGSPLQLRWKQSDLSRKVAAGYNYSIESKGQPIIESHAFYTRRVVVAPQWVSTILCSAA